MLLAVPLLPALAARIGLIVAAMAILRVDLDLGRAAELTAFLVEDLAAVLLRELREVGTVAAEEVGWVAGQSCREGREGGDGEDDFVLHLGD